MSAPSMMRIALILGLLSLVGPFSIDAYLPALPLIETSLGASISSIQLTLTMYFLGFGAAQLVYGPLADQAGRKLPIYIGLGLFGVASIGCTFAPTVETLAALRFIQGLGGAAVMVVPRAIIRDLYTGNDATRLMALVMMVISVSPMLAPLAGAGLMELGGWRVIFATLAVLSIGSLVLTATALPETLNPADRRPINVANLLEGMRILLTDRMFLGLTFVGGLGMASFFIFIASASFVYTQEFGLSPVGFSIAFAINAVGFFAASQTAAPLGMKFGMTRVMILGTCGFAVISLILLGIALAGLASLQVIVAMLFLANACLGLVIPTAMVMALEEHGALAGLASSLGGTLQMVTGGLAIAVAGPFFDGTATPMIMAIATCGVLATILALTTIRRS